MLPRWLPNGPFGHQFGYIKPKLSNRLVTYKLGRKSFDECPFFVKLDISGLTSILVGVLAQGYHYFFGFISDLKIFFYHTMKN
jgi:hypothetical protein